MAIKSRRGLAAGLCVALFVPALSFVIPALVQNRILPYEETSSMLGMFGMFSWASLALFGPIGIVIAARSAGVSGALGWLAVAVLVGPAYLAIWFASAVSLSGGLGSPF